MVVAVVEPHDVVAAGRAADAAAQALDDLGAAAVDGVDDVVVAVAAVPRHHHLVGLAVAEQRARAVVGQQRYPRVGRRAEHDRAVDVHVQRRGQRRLARVAALGLHGLQQAVLVVPQVEVDLVLAEDLRQVLELRLAEAEHQHRAVA